MSQKHTGFSGWMGERVDPTDESFRLFLARYIDRGPVANSKIQIDDDIVTYITEKDPKTHEFSALEFLAGLLPTFPTNGNLLLGIMVPTPLGLDLFKRNSRLKTPTLNQHDFYPLHLN